MIDKILGRDNTEEKPTEEQAVEPAEKPVTEKKHTKSGGVSLSIKGIWSGRAGEVNPQPSIEIGPGNSKLYYMIESSGKGFNTQHHITTVLINGRVVVHENGDIKEGDPTDTGVIPVPQKFLVPGNELKIQINLADWDGKELFKSPEFTALVT